jgi:uncharacterized membrane protein (DUF2068 family)
MHDIGSNLMGCGLIVCLNFRLRDIESVGLWLATELKTYLAVP